MGTEAVAEAVRLAVAGTRQLGFRGRAPTLRRELPDGTVQVVNFQRVVSGATGREPGFTINLNVVHGALRRAWAATDYFLGQGPVSTGMNVGIATRLGQLVAGRDEWYHPNNETDAERVTERVIEQLATTGIEWFDHVSDPDAAIESHWWDGHLPSEVLVAALLVERSGDPRRLTAKGRLEQRRPIRGESTDVLVAWLVERLAERN
jgi:hypothetical protein